MSTIVGPVPRNSQYQSMKSTRRWNPDSTFAGLLRGLDIADLRLRRLSRGIPRQVADAPRPERFEHRSKRSTVRRETIAHPKSWRLSDRACDDTIGFKLPQLLPQDFGGHSRHRPVKLA